jgi:hypothetical protein
LRRRKGRRDDRVVPAVQPNQRQKQRIIFMKTITLAGALAAGMTATLAGAALLAGPAMAADHAPSVALSLINGWINAPFGTNVASVETVSGNVVHFKGAIATTGTNPSPFVLPAAFRPATDVYVPVDMCDATKGRLYITHSGSVSVQAETNFSNAQCFTSLDGASFAKNATGFTSLAMINGWTTNPFSTSTAAVKNISGIVRLKGAIATSGTNAEPFVLPAGMRPATNVYVPVDMCNATNGRLIIQPTGDVSVQAESSFSNAQCFTSLDGVSFALPTLKALNLKHGWTNSPYGTAAPAAKLFGAIVHFQGAMVTSGTNTLPFTLPAAIRPSANVYVPVDLCNATNGRLNIQPSGVVSVEAETNFSNAQCFTSLDGVSYVK